MFDAVPSMFQRPPHLSKVGGSPTGKMTNEARLGHGYKLILFGKCCTAQLHHAFIITSF